MLRTPLSLLIVLLLGATTGAAQDGPSLGPDGEVGASLGLLPGVSSVTDRLVPVLGVSASLHLSPSLEVGGAGTMALRRVRVSPDDSPDRAELTLGYGGVLLRYHGPPGSGSNGWSAGVLLGGGTARVQSALVGQEVGTDNFFVVEPSISYRWYLRSALTASLTAGYRFTPGSDALPEVAAGQLQGLILQGGLRLLRHP